MHENRRGGRRILLKLVIVTIVSLAVIGGLMVLREFRVGHLDAVLPAGRISYDPDMVMGMTDESMEPDMAARADAGGPALAPMASPKLKLIYNAEMNVNLRKGDAETFAHRLREQVEAAGGYVTWASSGLTSGQRPGGSMTVRVPSPRLDGLMAWVAGNAVVTQQQVSSEDISERYVDLEARLANLKAGETRLGEILAGSAGELDQVLRVEQELRRIRLEIEQIEGKKRSWDNQVAFSKLEIRYQVADIYSPQEPQPETFAQRAGVAIRQSWKDFVAAMDDIAISGIYVLPWLPIVLVVTGTVWLAIRKAVRKSKQQ